MAATTIEMKALRKHLASQSAGPIKETAKLLPLLTACWDQLEGSDSERMTADKLWRMEDVTWQPPVLSFILERHGRTVRGSTRAGLHGWTVDLKRAEATCNARYSYRQLVKRQPSLKVEPMAKELAWKIAAGARDPRVKWLAQDSVRIEIGRIIPSDSAFAETVWGRRKRLKRALNRWLLKFGRHSLDGRLNTFQKVAQDPAARGEDRKPCAQARERPTGVLRMVAVKREATPPADSA